MDLSHVEPFEICSIRPPTENYSLTFRLTRNCYWNKCSFCPVYKFGARFSRRSLGEVFKDIKRAKVIGDLLVEEGIGVTGYSGRDYDLVRSLSDRIEAATKAAGRISEERNEVGEQPGETDPRLAWFASWFKEKPAIGDSLAHVLTWRMAGGETCFLGDSDGLILKHDFLAPVTEEVKTAFPTVSRFTVYGRTKSAARLRSVAELRSFHEAGLHRVHFGLESGSDKVLELIHKGVTQADHIEGCRKTREAGLSCSLYVMPGLGGSSLSEEHAHETARVINEVGPDFIRLRTLEIFPGTPLAAMAEKGAFRECEEEQVVRELKIMVEEIDAPTQLMSDSASNLLDLFGSLPADRQKFLEIIDEYLDLPKREKLIFSLESRLRSFVGQYGGLSEDLADALGPFVRHGKIDVSRAKDEELQRIIKLVRGKLMP